MSRGEGEESGWLLGPGASCSVSNSPTLKGSSNHGGDLANDVLIKRHISKRQLKRPEGVQAIRAHLYVDERESVDRPCIRIQGRGGSLASAANMHRQRGRERYGAFGKEIKRER